jgi:hypothetical protein
MKLLAAALAAAALGLPAAHASTPTALGLVYTPGYGNSIAARYDPVTLERSGPRVRLGGNANSWSWSPQRRYLAVASYPQRLTVFEAATMRVVSRIRLAPGGGVTHAVTWTRRDRVLAVVDTPGGAVIATADPLAGTVVRRLRIPRPFAFQFERLPDGLVFLLGARGRIAPAALAVVDAEGRPRVVSIPQAAVGMLVRAGRFEQLVPGLAVDPVGRKAYLVDGDRVFTVDLRTLQVVDPGPLRTLQKVSAGSTRSARWLGDGRLAVSGRQWSADGASRPVGLRIVDVRNRTTRTVDPTATAFTANGRSLLVEEAPSRAALNVTAYGFDGRLRYRLELESATWLKKQGGLGYACRDAFLRSVVDLTSGRTVRSGFPAGTRCPTLLVDDSRG